MASTKPAGSFDAMELHDSVLRAIKRKGFQHPTPIQRKAIPLVLQGVDVVGMARTGAGKTGAFVIPLVNRLGSHGVASGARTLLLAPTRELALQTYKVVTEIAKFTDLRTTVLVGGDSMQAQFAELAASPDIIIATPGRLLHQLEEVPDFNLKAVQHVVLDEADRLFEMGLEAQVRDIIKQTADTRQILLFSATLPSALAEFTRVGLRSPELVRLDADTKLSPDLKMTFFAVRHSDKPAALLQLLQEVLPATAPTLVFVATKHRIEYLSFLLSEAGVACCCVFGDMDQAARKISVGKFRAGRVRCLLVTDVAARGIDIPLIDNVVNYDFPPKPKLFVHRTGRAARGGRPGTAVSLVSAEDTPYLLDLHLFLSRPLITVPVSDCAAPSDEERACDKTSWLGSYPEALLDLAIAHVQQSADRSATLASLEKPCANAFALYKRTRPPASTESLRRSRALPHPGAHPDLLALARKRKLSHDAHDAAQHAEIAQALKRFRPAATVLESQVSVGKHAAAKAPRQAAEPPDARLPPRGASEQDATASLHTTASTASARANSTLTMPVELEPGRYRDAAFYISEEKADRHAEDGFAMTQRGQSAIAAHVLDLNGEDSAQLSGQKRKRMWDAKKKRYVTLQNDAPAQGGKRGQHSASAKGSDGKAPRRVGGLFQQWQKQTGAKAAQSMGQRTKGGQAMLAQRFSRGGRRWDNPLAKQRDGNASAGDVTKSESQMRKEAKKAQNRKPQKRKSSA